MSVVADTSAEGAAAAAAVANCNKFVEVLGLRALFPLFMHNPVAKGARLAAALHQKTDGGEAKDLPGPTAAQMQEHIIRWDFGIMPIVASFFLKMDWMVCRLRSSIRI